MRALRPAGLVAALALLLGLLSGCAVNGTIMATDQERRTLEIAPGTLVVVETFNGRVSVQGTIDPVTEVRITRRGSGTTQADAARDLANVLVEVAEDPGRLTITARRADPTRGLGNSGADLEILVPTDVSLELRSSNGRVEAANVTGSIVVRTSNGAITTRGGTDLDLDTTNDDISVSGPAGRLVLRTSNGAIDVRSALLVTLSARTSNARVTVTGSLAPGRHLVATTNGDLGLTLPGDAVFAIDGSTTNGTVRTDFPGLVVTETTIAGETAPGPAIAIAATTTNGSLEVMVQRP